MKILVGYKGVNVGKDLLDLAAAHAAAFKGEVLLVSSLIGGDRTKSEEIEDARQNLDAAKEELDAKGVKSTVHLLIRGMSPGEDIVAFAREHLADEIIIGVKSRSKVGKLLFGSTAQYVILKSPCPVVSVR